MNALYHREANTPKKFVVLKTNEDKTVDLAATDKGPPVITGCVVGTGQPGTCTLLDPKVEAAEKAAAEKAEAEAKAAAEKAAKAEAKAEANK